MNWAARLFRRRYLERQLDKELVFHQQEMIRDLTELGTPPDEARRLAALEFGGMAQVKEECRDARGTRLLHDLGADLRYACRVLRGSPGFARTAIFSLALGIGANTAVFSLVDATLLKSLPVRDPSQLRILTWNRPGGEPSGLKNHSGYGMDDEHGRHVDGSFSYPAYQVLRASAPQFSDLMAFAPDRFTVTALGISDLATGHFVSGNYFTGLGAQPFLGRPIVPDDDRRGKLRVAVLTHLFWKRRFGRDAGVIGRVIAINRESVTIVGVMPAGFQGLVPGPSVDLFVPMSMIAETSANGYSLAQPDFWWVQIFGRLAPGVSDTAAGEALHAALTHQIKSYVGPGAAAPEVILEPGTRGVGLLRSSIQNALYILAGIVAIVLLIACVNVANLLLARSAGRAKEMAIRASIGAGRGRLIRQLLTEGALLAGAGGAAGLLIAKPMLQLLLQLFAGTDTLGLDARLDVRALAFTFAASLLTGLLFAIVPAVRATRPDVNPGLKMAGAGAHARSPRSWVGGSLVSAQIAMSLLLLIGAGLFVRTLLGLAAVDLGFRPDSVLTFKTDPGQSGYRGERLNGIGRQLQSNLARLPGVTAVGMSHQGLMEGMNSSGAIYIPGRPNSRKGQNWFLYCSPSFLSAMRIPILLGRDLTDADDARQLRAAVVNEAFVKRYFPAASPIGHQFYIASEYRDGLDARPFTIVGVAGDAHYDRVRGKAPVTVYSPYSVRWVPDLLTQMVFVIRTQAPPLTLAVAVRQTVAGVDSTLPLSELRTERQQIDRSLGKERLFAGLVSVFGAIAALLAAIGLYGVVAYSVARRVSEIGIRVALGAGRMSVQWLVVRQSLLMAMLGVGIGIPAAFALSGLVKAMLYGVTPTDPWAFGLAVFAMVIVAGLSAWIPARQATRIERVTALRHE